MKQAKMKILNTKITQVMILLIVALTLVGSASATLVTQGQGTTIELLNYNPAPAEPGDLIDVWIQITNNGGTATKAGSVTIIPSYPFSVPSEADRVNEYTSIPSQETFLVKTKVLIDKDAHEGTNYLTVRLQEKGSDNWVEKDLAISIEGKSSAVSIVEAKTEPASIAPGGEGTLSLKVENVGLTKVRNLKVALDVEDLSVAPKGGGTSKTIDELKGGESTTFTFALQAFPDADAAVVQLPITFTYDDEEGNSHTLSETVGLVISSAPELLVYFDQIGPTTETPRGDVVIKFVNKGLAEIKLLEMEIVESEQVKVLSESPKLYVGNIDADDYESADITLDIKKDSVVIPVKVTYRDAINQEYEQTFELPLDLQSKNDKSGGSGRFGWFTWLVVIVIVAGAIWWWRKRKAKKKK